MADHGINPSQDLTIDIEDLSLSVNRDGSFNAHVKTWGFKPYLGVGWGNAIPRGRVGFRFDFGLLFQGKPSIESPNVKGNLSQYDKGNLDKVLKYAVVWPQISFQLTYRILKD